MYTEESLCAKLLILFINSFLFIDKNSRATFHADRIATPVIRKPSIEEPW